MEKTWRIALAQLSVVDGERGANLAKMEAALQKASDESADLLIFPELNLTGLVEKEQMQTLAEPFVFAIPK